MLEIITSINDALNGFIWGVPAMTCILGVGLYLAIRTKALHLRKFGYAMKNTFGKMFRKETAAEGALTPFQAVCTALSATIGTGNIAGVAGAIAMAAPAPCSGCGSPQFWAWAPSLLKLPWLFTSVSAIPRVIM